MVTTQLPEESKNLFHRLLHTWLSASDLDLAGNHQNNLKFRFPGPTPELLELCKDRLRDPVMLWSAHSSRVRHKAKLTSLPLVQDPQCSEDSKRVIWTAVNCPLRLSSSDLNLKVSFVKKPFRQVSKPGEVLNALNLSTRGVGRRAECEPT